MTTLAQPGISADRHARGFRLAGYDVVRFMLGLLLLTAVAFKGFELATESVGEACLLTSRWFPVTVVEFGFLFGLCLLRGLRLRPTRVNATALSSAFAGVAACKNIPCWPDGLPHPTARRSLRGDSSPSHAAAGAIAPRSGGRDGSSSLLESGSRGSIRVAGADAVQGSTEERQPRRMRRPGLWRARAPNNRLPLHVSACSHSSRP